MTSILESEPDLLHTIVHSVGDVDIFARELVVAAYHSEISFEIAMDRLKPYPKIRSLFEKYWKDVYETTKKA